MTPQEAQGLLALVEGTDASVLQEHMDWKDVAEALTTIASMRYEYDYEVQFGSEWTPQGYEFASFDEAQLAVVRRRRAAPAHIVRRLVGESEVVG